MKIKEIVGQIRRDFTAIYVCEHCDHECKRSGYDDENFHVNVIPNMECEECGKRADGSYIPRETKYPSWQNV
jgi:DNA replicative helicase MCM subunit Mcm2 (Cdc46/Mcm family)